MHPLRHLFSAVLLCSSLIVARAEAPDWLRKAALIPTPPTAAKAPIVVLLDETKIELGVTGAYTMVHRRAIRILRESAGDHAVGYVYYNGASDKVEALGAWLIRNSKTVESRGRSDWVDVAYYSTGAIIDESRVSSVGLSDKTASGDVFGYETRHRGPLVVAQHVTYFTSDLPTLRESLSIALPAGFQLESRTYGDSGAVVASQPAPNAWEWSYANPAYLPEESYEEPSSRRAAELFLRIIPSAGATKFPYKDFASWNDVMEYYLKLNAGQCDNSPALTAKAKDLTAGLTEPLAKIKALAQYVQKQRYVGINQKIKLGHGYRPRKASEVFATGYGDCKDKSNLLVAMLREVGIPAHSAGAYFGKERLPRPDSPSPMQFNHAIAAIEVGPELSLPAIVQDPVHGRLLFFDPTDQYTPLGDLPYGLQGSLVHVEKAGSNHLTPLPAFPAEKDFQLNRRLGLSIEADGAVLHGQISATGQSGSRFRQAFEAANMPKELEALVSRQLNDRYRAAAVVEKKTEDDPATGRCALTFTCALPKFIQWLPGRTGVVKLDLFSRAHLPNISETERQLPVGLRPMAADDEIVLTIPEGFVLAEVPAGAEINSAYGTCRISGEEKEGTYIFRRQVVIRESRVPVADYPALRKFLSDLAKADRATVLIKPKA